MCIKEENLRSSLEGICVSCAKPVALRDEWELDYLYKVGSCGSCGYDHHILVKKA